MYTIKKIINFNVTSLSLVQKFWNHQTYRNYLEIHTVCKVKYNKN